MQALAQQDPGARQDPETDQHRHQRVDPGPAGETDHDRGDDHPQRAEHVAPDLQVGALDVQAVALGRRQQAHAGQVHQQAEHGDHQHAHGLDLRRLVEPLVGRVEDIEGHAEQEEGVERRGEDLEAVVAVGQAIVGRAPGDVDRGQGDGQGHGVGEHVRGIGDQRQAAGEDAADDLGDEEASGQQQRPFQAGRVGLGEAVLVSGAHGGSCGAVAAAPAYRIGNCKTVMRRAALARRPPLR